MLRPSETIAYLVASVTCRAAALGFQQRTQRQRSVFVRPDGKVVMLIVPFALDASTAACLFTQIVLIGRTERHG